MSQGATAYNLIVTNDFPPTDFEFHKAWTMNGTDTYLAWPDDSTLASIKFTLTRKAEGNYTGKPADQTLAFTATQSTFQVASDETVDPNRITEWNALTLETHPITTDKGPAYQYIVKGLNSVWTVTDSDGAIHHGDWTYTISETPVPGYNAPRYVDKDGVPNSGTSQSDGCTVINDQSAVELPHTGGSGTTLYTVLGSVLISLAGILLLKRRRRLFI